MIESERREFCTVLVNCLGGYYRQANLDANLLGFWFDGLRRYPLADIAAALSRHATDPDRGQFPPKLADVVRQIEGGGSTSAGVAWSKVARAMRCVGGYASVVFDDPLIHAVIADMGGWTPLCRGADDELPFKARDFERRYIGYRAQQAVPPYPRRLIGENEASAMRFGKQPDPPALIGTAEACLRVYRDGGDLEVLPSGSRSARMAIAGAISQAVSAVR